MNIPFDSPVWQEDEYAQKALATLKTWQAQPPTADEFSNFIESNSSSDAVYESFFYSLPYVLDVLESKSIKEQMEMLPMLNWKLVYAEQGASTDLCLEQWEQCQYRASQLISKIISKGECSPSLLKYSLGALAALQGEAVLGLEINRLDE